LVKGNKKNNIFVKILGMRTDELFKTIDQQTEKIAQNALLIYELQVNRTDVFTEKDAFINKSVDVINLLSQLKDSVVELMELVPQKKVYTKADMLSLVKMPYLNPNFQKERLKLEMESFHNDTIIFYDDFHNNRAKNILIDRRTNEQYQMDETDFDIITGILEETANLNYLLDEVK
jgi:hypothetical protein